MIEEKKIAAAQYIITFYNEIKQLTMQEAYYINLMLEYETKYKTLDMEKITDEERKVIIAASQQVRLAVNTTYMSYYSLQEKLKLPLNKEMEALYNSINKTLIIKRDELNEFSKKINRMLVTEIIQTLLDTSQNYLQKIFQDEKGLPQNTG